MSKLKTIREQQNLTQEELSEKSGISVRTIQRIESGVEPKGHTLKILSKTFGIEAESLKNDTIKENNAKREFNHSLHSNEETIDLSKIKLINLSSVLFVVIPPFNILAPLIFSHILKRKSGLTKEIISIQILWTIFSVILFMLSSFAKNWYSLGSKFILVVMVLLALSNVFIILRNSAELDRKEKLFFQLNFNII